MSRLISFPNSIPSIPPLTKTPAKPKSRPESSATVSPVYLDSTNTSSASATPAPKARVPIMSITRASRSDFQTTWSPNPTSTSLLMRMGDLLACRRGRRTGYRWDRFRNREEWRNRQEVGFDEGMSMVGLRESGVKALNGFR